MAQIHRPIRRPSVAAALVGAALAAGVLVGCGGGGGGGGGPDATGGDDDDQVDAAPGTIDAAAPGGFTTLIASSWTVPSDDEVYQCQRLTVERDIYVKAFRAVTPVGTHHSVLTVGNPSGPDGASPCEAGTNSPAMIYGAGINTNDIELPEGVAMKVPAGQQLLLNLHLYNVSDDPIDGTSEVQVIEVDVADVEQEAEVVLMGRTLGMEVPPGPSVQEGACTMTGATTLFMVNPHMHQLGVHMKVEAARAGVDALTLHDADYDFTDQQIYPITPVPMAAGDKVLVHCGYDNPGEVAVPFGDSSDHEMCFATTYRYPALGAGAFGIVCDDGPIAGP